MSAKKFAQMLRDEVAEAQKKGLSKIEISNLIKYLDDFIKNEADKADSYHFEEYKAKWQLYIQGETAKMESNLEMFRSVISSGHNALKTAFLMNGGAIVAVLAFLGRLAETDNKNKIHEFTVGLNWFVFGLLSIAFATATTYMTQYKYCHDNNELKGHFYLGTTIILSFISYIGFILGVCEASRAFLSF